MTCEPYINPEWSELTLNIRSAFREYGQEWPPFVWNAVDDAIGKSIAIPLSVILTDGQTEVIPLNDFNAAVLIGKEIFWSNRESAIAYGGEGLTLNSQTGTITLEVPGQDGQVLKLLYRKKTD